MTEAVNNPAEFPARIAAVATDYAIANATQDYQRCLELSYVALSLAAGMSNMAYLQLQVKLQAQET